MLFIIVHSAAVSAYYYTRSVEVLADSKNLANVFAVNGT